MGEEGKIRELIAKFASPDPREAVDAIGELKKIGLQAIPILREASAYPSDAIRHYAMLTLRELKDERSIPIMAHALGDLNSNVADCASEALAGFGKKSIPAVLEVLGCDDIRAMNCAISTLAKIGEPAVSPLCEAYSDNPEPTFRIRIVCTLGSIAHVSAVPMLLSILSENMGCPASTPGESLALHAISSLGEIGDASALPSLFSLRLSSNLKLRVASADSLRGIIPTSPRDLRRLHAELLRTLRIEKGREVKNESDSLYIAYHGWSSRLGIKCAQAHEEMRAPPPRLGRRNSCPRRRNAAARRNVLFLGKNRV
ncbi:HEAT repeat domain-containing protein [Candidatus Micrarchaeota archaeon]|nr:HEAT repeat domain-containing protein [Candidatus Micrarchaeota archaeon]